MCLQLPTIINFWIDTSAKDEDLTKVDTSVGVNSFSNPLSPDVEDSSAPTLMDVATVGSVTVAASASGATLSRLAKVQREKQEMEAEAKDAQTELLALRKEMATLKQGAQVLAVQPGDEAAAAPASVEPLPPPPPTEPSQVQALAMKEVIADETLSEETRQAAKETLETLVGTQLLQSKVVAFAITAERKAEAQQRERNVVLANVAADARFSNQYAATRKQAMATFDTEHESFVGWLRDNRLVHHEQSITDVAGTHTSLEDFGFLTEDDLTEISAKMTRVEGLRFAAAVSVLQE